MARWNHTALGNHTVDCIPIQALFDAAGLQDIDLFSLDVEGAELAVLHTIDFSVTNIHVVLVEATLYDLEKNESVRKFLKERGFKLHKADVGHSNEVWVNEEFEEIRSAHISGKSVHDEPVSLLGRVQYKMGTAVRC